MTQLEEAITLFGWSSVKGADSARALLYSARHPRDVAIAARELKRKLSDVELAKSFTETLEPELKNALLCALMGDTGIQIINQQFIEIDENG